jgi:hypothetical protein
MLKALCRDCRSCNHRVSDGCAVSPFDLERVEFAAEPDIRAPRSNRCHARAARIFVLRLLGISRQDSGERMGRMSERKKRLLSFAGI